MTLSSDVPDVFEIPNTTIVADESMCFDAQQTLIVAGQGKHFIVQAGGHADLIAGSSILLKPGTSVELSGSLHARISNIFCTPQQSLLASLEEEHVPINPGFETELKTNFFKVYPNPTTGDFTLELHEKEEASFLLIEIYTMQGNLILSSKLPAEQRYNISLSGRQAGIYLIRVMQNTNTGTARIIKQ